MCLYNRQIHRCGHLDDGTTLIKPCPRPKPKGRCHELEDIEVHTECFTCSDMAAGEPSWYPSDEVAGEFEISPQGTKRKLDLEAFCRLLEAEEKQIDKMHKRRRSSGRTLPRRLSPSLSPVREDDEADDTEQQDVGSDGTQQEAELQARSGAAAKELRTRQQVAEEDHEESMGMSDVSESSEEE